MPTLSKTGLVGYIELKVGSLAVQVPIRTADPRVPEESSSAGPLAQFAIEGDNCVIVIRGEPSSMLVENAVREAAHQAERHLSRKLLN
jgi:hypothetical protein